MSTLRIASSSATHSPNQEPGPAGRASESGDSKKEPLPDRSHDNVNDARPDAEKSLREPVEPNNSLADGEASAQKDDEKDPLPPEIIRLGKKISRAVNILEQEIEEALDEHRIDVPESLDKQIENLRKLGKALNKQEKSDEAKSDDDDDEWLCEVARFTMDDWQKDYYDPTDSDAPRHVVKAYYRTAAPADENVEQSQSSNLRRAKCPQRVIINSQLLKSELEEVSELNMVFLPVLMAPPFKFLSRFHGQIADRLTQLKQQLEEMRREQVAKMEEQKQSQESRPVTGRENSPSTESRDTPDKGPLATSTTDSQDVVTSKAPTVTKGSKGQEAVKKEKLIATRINHLQVLYDFIMSDLAYYLDLQTRIEDGSLATIAFEDLWYLFRPGETIYTKNEGFEQLLRVYSVTGGQPRRRNHSQDENEEIQRRRDYKRNMRSNRYYDDDAGFSDEDEFINKDALVEASGIGTWSPLTIDCYLMGFDGLRVGPVDSYKKIKHYSGECDITELPCYPLRFHKRRADISARLEARGRKFLDSYGHKSYSGLTLPLTKRGYPEELHGDVFLDAKTYYTAYPRRRPKLGLLRKTLQDETEVQEYIATDVDGVRRLFDHEVDDKVTDDSMASSQGFADPIYFELAKDSPLHLQLLPHQIPAFVFRTRQYVHVDIGKIADIDKSDEARDKGFDDLVIPETHRDLLVALVQNHDTGGQVRVDVDELNKASTQIEIVRGKGRGLIILLHGPPGSGKTSTAETIAASTRRPLYSITCGDLGTEIRDVELSLREHTERAHRWGCVLLLDEADVFLTRRDWRDMSRNALVSVFLRELEYYSGILFLTTNRVGVIDEAFKSRIHVSLRYPRIQQRETRQIWENILNRLERNNKTAKVKIKFDKASLLEFAEKHYRKNEAEETTWNGRQIRNAFQTAIALGHYDREKRLKAAGMTADDAARSGQKTWMTVKLTRANFRHIAKTASEFDDYLASVRGPDSSLAKESQLRDDTHDQDILASRKGYGTGASPRPKSGYLSPSYGRPPPTKTRAGSSPSKRSEKEDDSDDDDEDISDENLSDD